MDDWLERRANPEPPPAAPTPAGRLAELAMDLADHLTGGNLHDDEPTRSPEWMTVEETAAYLGLSADLIYREIAKGAFPALRVGDRKLVPRSGLGRFVVLSAVLVYMEKLSGPEALKGLLQTFFNPTEPPWPMQPVNSRGWIMAGRRQRSEGVGS